MLMRRAIAFATVLVSVATATGAPRILEARQGAPGAVVPTELQGTWNTFFGSLGPVHVQMKDRSAIVFSERNQRLGYLAGTLSSANEFTLKVLWELPAFQQGIANPLPAAAWTDAVLDKGDPAFPGYLATTVKLHYDTTADELLGTYTSVNVRYDHDTKKYKDTQTRPVSIRLVRDGARPGCAPLPDNKPIFTLSRHGAEAIVAEASVGSPIAEQFAAVDVKTVVALPVGAPGARKEVEGGEVAWEVQRNGRAMTTFYTETDDNGVGKLQFVLQPDGGFAPADQIKSRPITLPAGDYTVVARIPSLDTPDYELSPGLAKPPAPPPVTFKLTLRRKGVLLNFLDETGANAISVLSWPGTQVGRYPWARPFFRLEMADFAATDEDNEKTVVVRSYEADGKTVHHQQSITLTRVGQGIYRYTGKPIEVYFAPAGVNVPGVRSTYLYVVKQPVNRVTATYEPSAGSPTTAELTVFDDPLTMQREQMRRVITAYRAALDGIRASSHALTAERKELLDYKQRLLNKALAALDNPKLHLESTAPLLVADAYLRVARQAGPFAKPGRPTFYWQRKGAGQEVIGLNSDPNLVEAAIPVESANEFAALAVAQRSFWEASGLSSAGQELDEVAGFGVYHDYLPKDSAARAAAIRQILIRGTLNFAKGAASIAFSQELGLIYAAWVLASGTTLDGENADAIDFLTAGLDLASFDLHTGPGEALRDRISRKVQRVRDIRKVAGRIAANPAKLTFEELDYATQIIRLKNDVMSKVWKVAKDPTMSLSQQMRQISRLMTRVPNAQVARLLNDELATIPGVLNARLGTYFHRQKELETKAFFEWMADAGKVSRGPQAGIYTWRSTVNGVEATYYELVEVGNGAKRLDGALGKVSSTESNVLIRDLTTKLDPGHFKKGQGYKGLVAELIPALRNLPTSYCEYYWTETNAAGALGTVRLKHQLDKY